MALTRRGFGLIGLSALAGLALGPLPATFARRGASAAGEDGPLFDWRDLPGGARVAMGQGGNALLVMSRGESMLVDCKNPGFGATLRRECERYGSPLSFIVNTHHHADHVGGNTAFAGLPIRAHSAARPRIVGQAQSMLSRAAAGLRQLEATDPPPPARALEEVRAFVEGIGAVNEEDFAPTDLTDQPVRTERLGSVEVALHHFGPGHTDNDIVVHIPALNTIHAGDLIFHRLHPFIDRPAGATTRGWQRSLQRIIDLCDGHTAVIPGHGEPTDASGVREQIDYFDKMREVVRHARDVEGMTRDEVTALTPGAFAEYGFGQMLPRVLGAVFDEAAEEG